ncbi:MAG: diadenylate cyclase, partial [Thermodesulfobacteriota bacterium]|nr:diadenylate cyclase [Thermodesulfobacteriota bacterium]
MSGLCDCSGDTRRNTGTQNYGQCDRTQSGHNFTFLIHLGKVIGHFWITDNAETIKEFAQLDGAFIIDANGIVRASGRYIAVSNSYDLNLLPGLGGRHLAAASITTLTD